MCAPKSAAARTAAAPRTSTPWHGPYHEWSRREDGRLLHSVVTPEQAKLLTEAINNHRKVQQLLDRRERETAAEILGA